MATDLLLKFTDGTTTCTFGDGAGGATDYQLADNTWAPAIAGLRQSELGGRGPYEDVVETMEIHVTGSTVPACLANVAKLARLLDQAARWARGDNVAAVVCQYSPKGATVSSAADPLQVVVLDGAVELPPSFTGPYVSQSRYVAQATLRFARRGLWLHTDTTATSASAANPSVLTVTPADHATLSPTKIAIRAPAVTAINDGFVIVAQQASDIQLVEAETGAAGAWTSVADGAAAGDASGGSVLRYTPTGTSESGSAVLSIASLTPGTRRIMVLAAVRDNSGVRTFQLKVQGQVALSASTFMVVSQTPWKVIDYAGGKPQILNLGILAAPPQADFARLQLWAKVDSITGTPTLDIDYVVAVAIDNPRTSVIGINPVGATTYNAWDLVLDHQSLTHLSPTVYGDDSVNTDIAIYAWKGDPYIVSSGITGALLLLSTSDTNWVLVDTLDVPVSHTFTLTRHKAYLTPE